MAEKKLHIVHTESSGGWGGQEIRILNESLEFIKNGYQITLLCDANTPIAERARQYNIATVELPIGKKNIKGLFAIRKWIAQHDFDIVNTHSSSDTWMTALGMRMTLKRKPLIRTRHVSAPVSNNKATQWLYQKASDHIVTTGEKLRETLITENRINGEKITSVATGIDCQKFIPPVNQAAVRKSLGLPEDHLIIGIVATLRSWKGHKYLIDAFSKFNQAKIHLLIVGDGPQWDNINTQIDELNLRNCVTLSGDQQDVVPWLQAMDIFVLPSYANEGVPQSIMQAMSCGLPVISTDVGSIKEIITEETGIIVNTKDANHIKDALENLISDKKNQEKLKNKANIFAKKYCSIETMFKKMEKIYLALA